MNMLPVKINESKLLAVVLVVQLAVVVSTSYEYLNPIVDMHSTDCIKICTIS